MWLAFGGPWRVNTRKPIVMFARFIAAAALIPALALAQNGDKAGEAQVDPIPPEQIPAAPPLSPADALKTFKVPPGFRVELVACEPLIEAPVAMTFDPNGRLWVLEMRGFMRNPEGKGEDETNGRISVLEDTDGDGRMDKSTVFQEGLILPRAMTLFRDGLLVAEPPKLWFFRDQNGDLKADEKVELFSDYGGRENPEHTANSLTWAMDNWIYSANHTTRYRNVSGQWEREPTVFRGQWGLTQDDSGRLFFNSNSDQLRVDLVPSHYLARNPNLRGAYGLNVQTAKDQIVWPARMNPGVNRGYQKGQLRADGSLATFTGACGPVIYRGDNFPAEFRGNAFLCEPTGNLVRRNVLTEKDSVITAQNPYDKTEFLTSTDERFRPVNLFNAPDGALYVVDMYRGIIQHRIFLTSYLRKQALSRGLEKSLDQGRIYRVVHESAKPAARPALAKAGVEELVKALSHPNGWWRDTAQRLLVERRDSAAAPALRKLASTGESPLGRLHALWTLEGAGQLDEPTLLTTCDDAQPVVAAAALRLSEQFIKASPGGPLWSKIAAKAAKADNLDSRERLQLAFTLGEVKTPEAEALLEKILRGNNDSALLRDAAISGLAGRELEFLQRLAKAPAWSDASAGPPSLVASLAKCVFAEGKPERASQLFDLAVAESAPGWLRGQILGGLAGLAPKAAPGKQVVKPRLLKLAGEPAGLAALRKAGTAETLEQLAVIETLVTWPGKPGAEPEKVVTPLTKEEKARFDAGKELYLVTCGACHQPTGLGQEGLAPPLLDSAWSVGSEQRLIRIVLQGVRGKISVKDRVYEMEMPPLGVLDDEQIASALTYIRREWGHTASPVDAATVAKVRKETDSRLEAWTEPDLLRIP